MRIGIDATTIYTDKPTGLGIYSINVINELARIHDDLVVWTVDDSSLKLDPHKIRRVMQPFSFLGNKLYQLRPLWVQFVLPHLIRREKIDLLYSTIPNGLCGAPVPHIMTVHDIIPLVFPADSPRAVTWNFKYRLPKIFDQASSIVAISEYTRTDLLNHYELDAAKVRVISEGYDRDNFSPPQTLDRLAEYGLSPDGYILYVGNSSPRKNVLRLVEAFARVKDAVTQDLVLAGSKTASQIREIEALASRHGVGARVKLLDYVPYADLPLLYGGAALFVFISEYEGFGLPVLEAMACGAPVMAADATSLPEVLGEAGVLVDPLEVDDIADGLRKTLSDARLRNEMKARARKRAALFSWEQTARELLDLFRNALRA